MNIKRLVITGLLGCLALAFSGCPSGKTAKDAVGAVTKKTVGAAKGVISGVSGGIDEGRKETPGLDGARVVTTYAEVTALLGVELLKTGADENGRLCVTLGFANNTDAPVRVSGLGAKTEIMVLDKDGYVTRLASGPLEITIPSRAKDKADFYFDTAPGDAVTMRLFEGEIALKKK